jgi:hypothetical protein
MPELNLWAAVVAAVASFVAAFAYYALFGRQLAEFGGAASEQPPTWLVPAMEVAKGLVIPWSSHGLRGSGTWRAGPTAWSSGSGCGLRFP